MSTLNRTIVVIVVVTVMLLSKHDNNIKAHSQDHANLQPLGGTRYKGVCLDCLDVAIAAVDAIKTQKRANKESRSTSRENQTLSCYA